MNLPTITEFSFLRPTILTIHFLSVMLVLSTLLSAEEQSRLRVADNHRYLEYENGDPFLYIGDTAWELFHRLNREEAELYLTNRAEKGFTVIQAVAIPQAGNLKEPNAYGHLRRHLRRQPTPT